MEPNGGQPISNETIKGYVELTKTDATYGGTLANAVYGIYTENGTQAGTLTTDSSGYAKSGPLPLRLVLSSRDNGTRWGCA
ncbi:MAG: SpaA isopeptide-forming pilin-related protein [[Clostridium] leptum]